MPDAGAAPHITPLPRPGSAQATPGSPAPVWAPITALEETAETVGAQHAGPFADEVDRDARFPHESVQAMRDHRMLSSSVPVELGGGGASLHAVAGAVRCLAHHCTTTALVFAMHQIQVAMLVDHGNNDTLRQFLRDLTRRQLLLGNAASEVGIGGDARTSSCALERDAGRFRIDKLAATISYGEFADALLTTARKDAEAESDDQVIALCQPPGLLLESTDDWDTLGLRGTCSRGFHLIAEGSEELVFPVPFGEVASYTGLPVGNILLGSVWLGLAEAAAAIAHRHVRTEARRRIGVVPTNAVRLAELVLVLQSLTEVLEGVTRRYEHVRGTDEAVSARVILAMQALKVSSSKLALEVVERAVAIAGAEGYHDGSGGLGRHLRDAHGAVLMVGNDRVLADSARILLTQKRL
jgi:acyl-CoA dehydrogenase